MIRRRHMLQASAAVLAAPAIVNRANAQSAFDWKQCKGQSIEVNFQLSPRGDLAKRTIPKFEELTGIKVGFEQIPEQQQRPKVAMEMATGHPSFDVVNVGMHVRLLGHPGRAAGLTRFLDYVISKPDVWICKRIEIARHWLARHPPEGVEMMASIARPGFAEGGLPSVGEFSRNRLAR